MIVDGVEVKILKLPEMTMAEVQKYVAYTKTKVKGDLQSLIIKPGRDTEEIALVWEAQHEQFERIRRITGYLVGTTDRWNNAKKAEERDRVKHA